MNLNLQKTNNLVKKWAQDLIRYFSKEDIYITKKHMQRRSTSLIIRQMQIKTRMMYHLIPVRMAIIKKSTNKCRRGCRENRILLHCWWKCKVGAANIENCREIPQKTKIELSCCGSSISCSVVSDSLQPLRL